MSDLICYSFLMFIETPCINFTRDYLFDALFRFALYGLLLFCTACFGLIIVGFELQMNRCLALTVPILPSILFSGRRLKNQEVQLSFGSLLTLQIPAISSRALRTRWKRRFQLQIKKNMKSKCHSECTQSGTYDLKAQDKIISKYPQYNRCNIQTSTRIFQTSANHTAYPFTGTSLSSVPSLYLTQRVACTKCIYLKSVAEFKEFERRFKFKPWLKYGWFHLKFYQMFQDLSRRLI